MIKFASCYLVDNLVSSLIYSGRWYLTQINLQLLGYEPVFRIGAEMNTFVAWCGKEPKTILRECALTSGLGNLWGNIAAPSKLSLSQHGLITWALMPFHKVEKAAWMRREKTLKYRELVFYFVCAHITFFLQIWFASLLPFKKILKFFDFPLCSAFFACLGFSSRLKKYSSLIPRLDDHKLAFLISKPGLAGCWTSNLPPYAKFLVGEKIMCWCFATAFGANSFDESVKKSKRCRRGDDVFWASASMLTSASPAAAFLSIIFSNTTRAWDSSLKWSEHHPLTHLVFDSASVPPRWKKELKYSEQFVNQKINRGKTKHSPTSDPSDSNPSFSSGTSVSRKTRQIRPI